MSDESSDILRNRITELEYELAEITKRCGQIAELKSIIALRNLELEQSRRERESLAIETAQLKRYLQGEHQ